MRHTTWMKRDERTPLQQMQDRLRFQQEEERRLLKELETVRERIGWLSLQIAAPSREIGKNDNPSASLTGE